MNKIRYISVPLNEKGIEDYNYGKEDSNNIKVFELSENEFDNLYNNGIFDKINFECNLLIDDYESEEISGSNLEMALNIVKENKCDTLVKALELAIKYNTLVGLDF
ncbi:MAG: hypothetical protein MSA89_12250 [Clostridium sp.]|nr:hypothetical protein [Clostridium sp.]MCI7443829.1 hypothetical protein [Clostridium sp.]